MNIFNLFAKITLDKDSYEKGIDSAKAKNKEFEKSADKTGNKAKIAFGAITTAIVLVTKATMDLIRASADYADQIGDLAGKWGFTTKEIQEFDYWATMSGTTLDSLLTGMRGLVNQAEAGSSAFAKLGVSVRNADGSLKDQKTLFLETIDALKEVDNQTERNALQFEIFGRAGIELGQIISRDSEELQMLSQQANDLGIILSDTTIEQAGEFNDTLDQLRLSFKSVMAELVAGADGAEERFVMFMDRLELLIKKYAPRFAKIAVDVIGLTFQTLLDMLPSILDSMVDGILNYDWGAFIGSLVQSILGAVWDIIAGRFQRTWGWLLGGGTEDKEYQARNQDSVTNANSLNTSTYTSSVNNKTDNSTYNLSINMNSTGYTQQDARTLAEEVIKEINIKKQASGR